MKVTKCFNKYKKEDGAVIAIVAVFMAALIGFSAIVLDLGIAYNGKAKLQISMDSSALAAARDLPLNDKDEWSDVIEVAKKYAEDNGVEDANELEVYAIDADDNELTVNNSNYSKVSGVKVSGEKTVDYNFARVFGVNSSIVGASATAKLVDIAGMKGLAPFVLTEDQIEGVKDDPDKLVSIKYKENKMIGNEPGWFGAVRINEKDGKEDSGADPYENAFINGSNKEHFIGGHLYLENGNMVGPTTDGYAGRIEGHEDCQLNDCKKPEDGNCSRKIVIPIIEIVYKNNNIIDGIDYLLIKGFASVFLAGYTVLDEEGKPVMEDISDTDDKESVLVIQYVEKLNVPGATAVAGKPVNAYNVLAVKLVD